MKKLLLILPLFVGLILFNSCKDEEVDPYYVSDTETFMKQGEDFNILADRGIIINPGNQFPDSIKIKDGMRVKFFYWNGKSAKDSEVYDYSADVTIENVIPIKSLFNITKETTKAEKDSIGDDFICLENIWFTVDYLNIKTYNPNYGKIGLVTLVYDELNPTTEEGQIILQLMHNQDEEVSDDSISKLVSFDVSQFKVEGKSKIEFLVKSYGYNKDKVLTYDYSDKKVLNNQV